MLHQKKQNITSWLAIIIFCMFWLFVLSFKIFHKTLTSKASGLSWIYTQTLHQNFSFFTQPAIYNDRVEVYIKDKSTKKIDSIDVMKLLWSEKKMALNYTYANTWDHIMYRNSRNFREALLQNRIDTTIVTNYFCFIKTFLSRNNYSIVNKDIQFKLYSDFTKSLHRKNLNTKQLIYTSSWID